MSDTTNNIPPRIEALMVEAATQGLSPQDQAELQAALAGDEALRVEAEAYQLAATAAELAMTKSQGIEALPTALRDKLIASASARAQAPAAAPALKLSGTAAAQTGAAPSAKFSFTDGRMFGWYAAAAALIALAFVLTLGPKPQGGVPEPTLAQRYEALANEPDAVAASWGFNPEGGDPAYANATGEVVWNSDTQTGYMKLAGLPVNDPTKEQYQLWIVDASRDKTVENTDRIDGGVFDITSTGEVIVPINAKLIARNAAVFAITVEASGGVVESKGPLQMVAVVEKS